MPIERKPMDAKQASRMLGWTAATLCLFITLGCGTLRSEFFRGETAHLLEQGNRHYRSGEYQKAESCYKEVVHLDPDCASGHAALGNTAYVRGAFQTAAACYRQAMALDPKLEKPLSLLLLDARRMQERKALEACGVSLSKVLALLSSGRGDEVESLLSKDVSVAMLARHRSALPPKDQEQLLCLVREQALSGKTSGRCALLYGHLLAVDERGAFLAAKLLEAAAKTTDGEEQQEAYMALGALYVRMGLADNAAWAYEAALRAGRPRDEVLPLLADLYGMPANAVEPPEFEQKQDAIRLEEKAPPVLTGDPPLSGSLERPNKDQPNHPASVSHAPQSETDRTFLMKSAEPTMD